MHRHRKSLLRGLGLFVGLGVLLYFFAPLPTASREAGLTPALEGIVKERGLKPSDIEAALKTYVPTGKYDDYLMFSSTGHAGQVLVIGVPSMRILKTIAVFTPEPWQGFGFGSKESAEVLKDGAFGGRPLTWGDTHHPALSETDGEYDGRYLFINDKANARMAVIDLRDFEVKQIVKEPNMVSDHGGPKVTPSTEYIIIATQYNAPFPIGTYAPLEAYKEKYRGLIAFLAFDRKKGRIDLGRSFEIEVPPYWQDLCDAGKKVSDGWAFCNSFNTELATGGIEAGQPPLEVGVSQREMDYMHIVNWKKAERVARTKARRIGGIRVIPLKTAIREGILFFAPEPKSPHGLDVTPGGDYLVVSGKLDPHVTIYSFDKIRKAISEKKFGGTDPYGVPILRFDDVMAAQVEVGLGPLHTEFDDQGHAYTSLFIESAVAKWSLGEPYKAAGEGWKLVDKIPIHYNVGHLTCAEGDTVSPDGRYCVSLNKWSIDRFAVVGPLHPQNFQLLDVSGEKMQLLYDLPIGLGEPHYAQIIKADKLKGWTVYPKVGMNPLTMRKDPNAVRPGKERIVRRRNTVEVWMTAIRSHFNPERIAVKQGDRVIVHLTNIERARDATHGLAIDGYNINVSVEPGEATTIEFVADRPGVYPFYCTEFCSALHLEMAGYLLVEPS